MNEVIGNKPPIWFWIVAILLLVWNIMGVMAYILQMQATPEQLAESYPSAMLEIIASTPTWATAAFAISVWAGLLGDIALLLRRAWARILFVFSLLGVLAQHTWTFLISGYMDHVSGTAIIFPLLVVAICVFQIWLGSHGIKRGWLR